MIDDRNQAFANLKSQAEIDAAKKIIELLDPLSQFDRRSLIEQARDKLASVNTRRSYLSDEVNKLKSHESALVEYRDWSSRWPWTLTPPQGSSWHKLNDAFAAGEIVTIDSKDTGLTAFFDAPPSVFIVEHDWAAAFSGAEDFDAGAFRTPFPLCCFEFVIGGKRVMGLAMDENEEVRIRVFAQCRDAWISPTSDDCLCKEVARQIRAICIVLETTAVTATKVLAPAKLNAARIKRGEAPMNDYHVIRISAGRLARHAGDGEGKWKVRCHFRRGHWRHYENYKVWIKWMLVGDPNLGFVDKHYRL